MNRTDFQKLIGATNAAEEYLPVACLLSTGYGCAGYYSSLINNNLEDTCVLLNARLVELDRSEGSRHVSDFNDFIEDIVATHYQQSGHASLPSRDSAGGSIPLTAIPFNQISLVYPVAHIASLLKQARPQIAATAETESTPTFLDFDNKSIVLKALRTKLW
ncbi:MAG: hypothetical protein WAO83_16295 [Fuerstiella sp.]